MSTRTNMVGLLPVMAAFINIAASLVVAFYGNLGRSHSGHTVCVNATETTQECMRRLADEGFTYPLLPMAPPGAAFYGMLLMCPQMVDTAIFTDDSSPMADMAEELSVEDGVGLDSADSDDEEPRDVAEDNSSDFEITTNTSTTSSSSPVADILEDVYIDDVSRDVSVDDTNSDMANIDEEVVSLTPEKMTDTVIVTDASSPMAGMLEDVSIEDDMGLNQADNDDKGPRDVPEGQENSNDLDPTAPTTSTTPSRSSSGGGHIIMVHNEKQNFAGLVGLMAASIVDDMWLAMASSAVSVQANMPILRALLAEEMSAALGVTEQLADLLIMLTMIFVGFLLIKILVFVVTASVRAAVRKTCRAARVALVTFYRAARVALAAFNRATRVAVNKIHHVVCVALAAFNRAARVAVNKIHRVVCVTLAAFNRAARVAVNKIHRVVCVTLAAFNRAARVAVNKIHRVVCVTLAAFNRAARVAVNKIHHVVCVAILAICRAVGFLLWAVLQAATLTAFTVVGIPLVALVDSSMLVCLVSALAFSMPVLFVVFCTNRALSAWAVVRAGVAALKARVNAFRSMRPRGSLARSAHAMACLLLWFVAAAARVCVFPAKAAWAVVVFALSPFVAVVSFLFQILWILLTAVASGVVWACRGAWRGVSGNVLPVAVMAGWSKAHVTMVSSCTARFVRALWGLVQQHAA